MKSFIILLLVGVAVAQGVIRLAPLGLATRHIPPEMPEPGTGNWPEQSGIRVAKDLAGSPAEVLARFEAIALATPRTIRAAGDTESGLVTYVTRSAFWGFPDFTTVSAEGDAAGTRLKVHARMWFPGSDWGVNRARLRAWLEALDA